RRATVDELVRIVVAAFRKLSSLPAIAKTRRSSQETRSNHAGPTGRSKFAAGRCDILAMSSTPGSCILLVSIILYQQKAHGMAMPSVAAAVAGRRGSFAPSRKNNSEEFQAVMRIRSGRTAVRRL